MNDQGQKLVFGAVGLLVGVLLTVGYFNMGAVNGESMQGKLGNVVPGQGKVNDSIANPQIKVPTNDQCWTLYKMWLTNSMTAYMSQNKLNKTDLAYCTNSVIGQKQWFYTTTQCTEIYNAWNRTKGGYDFSGWLQKNNIPAEAALYCSYKTGKWWQK